MMKHVDGMRVVLAALLVAAPAVAFSQEANLGAAVLVEVNDAAALGEFNQHVAAYVELHRRIEAALPALSNEATPVEIDARQRRLAIDLGVARTTAAQGDLFTTPMQILVRRLIAELVAQPDGHDVVSSVMEENPRGVPIAVNARFPDALPLSTMPPQLLMRLPKMPEELEYRFVGIDLVILDPHAHLIVDLVPNALPE